MKAKNMLAKVRVKAQQKKWPRWEFKLPLIKILPQSACNNKLINHLINTFNKILLYKIHMVNKM